MSLVIYLLFYRTHVLCILGSECVVLSIVVYFHNRKKPRYIMINYIHLSNQITPTFPLSIIKILGYNLIWSNGEII